MRTPPTSASSLPPISSLSLESPQKNELFPSDFSKELLLQLKKDSCLDKDQELLLIDIHRQIIARCRAKLPQYLPNNPTEQEVKDLCRAYYYGQACRYYFTKGAALYDEMRKALQSDLKKEDKNSAYFTLMNNPVFQMKRSVLNNLNLHGELLQLYQNPGNSIFNSPFGGEFLQELFGALGELQSTFLYKQDLFLNIRGPSQPSK